MNVKAIPFKKDGEQDKFEHLAIFTFHDPSNRKQGVLDCHTSYHNRMGFPINYIKIDYRTINHGQAMNNIIDRLSEAGIDHFVFLDNDALILRRDGAKIIYNHLKDGNTLFGGAQNSNHININPKHPFVQPSTFCISRSLYDKLGRPQLGDHFNRHRSDTCEEATWLCQEKGYTVSMLFPSHYSELTDEEAAESGAPKAWPLTDTLNYGIGTTYGDLFFHSGMQGIDRSYDLLKNKGGEVLRALPRIEGVTVCVGMLELLKLSYKQNKPILDNFIVVTSSKDKDTQEWCEGEDAITCVVTDRFYENGAKVDKGAAINEGLKKLKYNDWVLHLDCDVVLPDNYERLVLSEFLDKNTLHGASRWFLKTKKEYDEIKSGAKSSKDFEHVEGGHGCGYYQLFNMGADCLQGLAPDSIYPSYPTAAESDILFLKRFHPNIDGVGRPDNLWVCHLGGHGVNHEGKSVSALDFFVDEEQELNHTKEYDQEH